MEKKAPEPESTVQGQAAGQGHGVEHSSEVNSCKEVEGTHAPELTLTWLVCKFYQDGPAFFLTSHQANVYMKIQESLVKQFSPLKFFWEK